jgi:hypothetical protein
VSSATEITSDPTVSGTLLEIRLYRKSGPRVIIHL